VLICGGSRKFYVEDRPFSVLALHSYGATLLGDKFVADSKAKPCALGFGSKKRRKYLPENLRRYSRAGIRNA